MSTSVPPTGVAAPTGAGDRGGLPRRMSSVVLGADPGRGDAAGILAVPLLSNQETPGEPVVVYHR